MNDKVLDIDIIEIEDKAESFSSTRYKIRYTHAGGVGQTLTVADPNFMNGIETGPHTITLNRSGWITNIEKRN